MSVYIVMPELTVATFNLHHCEGRDGLLDVERVAKVMQATEADVIGLQELDRGMPRSSRVDQPSMLAELTGMHVAFHRTLLGPEGSEFGIGLATREPVQWKAFPLPQLRPEHRPQGVIVADLGVCTLLSTHVSGKRATRAAKFRALVEITDDIEGPVCLMGDLNQEPGRVLRDAGFTGPRPPVTFPSLRRRLDHVLGLRGVVVGEVWTLPSDASDHYPLVARLNLPETLERNEG